MAIKRTFNGATIIKPGAYSKVIVEMLTGFPLQPTGVVGIVGEAVGGEPRVIDILSRERIQDAKARYKSGPIADALELLVNPSKDPRVPNGASTIVVYKVNAGTQSQLNLVSADSINQILLKSANYGDDENNLNVLVSAGSVTDLNAALAGSVAGPFALAGGETLILISGNTTYTFTNTLVGAAITASALVAELNTAARWSGSIKPVIASGTSFVALTVDPLVVIGATRDYGYLKVDPASTLDLIAGITGENRGRKGGRFVTLRKGSTVETTLEIGGLDVMSIKYVGAGTAATMTLQDVAGVRKLTTVCTGAAGDNLDLTLRDADGKVKYTVKQLVDLINAHAAYEAMVLFSNPDVNADHLDFYSALDIRNVAAVLRRDTQDMLEKVNAGQLATATKISNIYKEVATFGTPRFFAGATDGTSTNADWVNAFEAFKEERINVVVPLISEDVGALSIDSINAAAAAHAAWGWSTTGRSERSAFTSKKAAKEAFKTACRNTASGYVSMFGQEPQVLNRLGELEFLRPWAAACIAAGLRCGAEVGEPLTFKLVNVNNIRVADGSWNPKKDYAEMIEAGATILEPLDSGGFRIVLGNTTYGADPNFVWNRESVVQAAGYIAYDLRFNLELVFTGTKARTGTAEAIANFIKSRMTAYLEADITVGDDLNEGLGFSKLGISVQGNTALINISVTPVQGVDFILPTIYLSDIRQTA